MFCKFTYNQSVAVTILCVYFLYICACLQAIDELKKSLFDIGVQFTEETLVVVEDNTVDSLSKDTFVSLCTVNVAYSYA